MGPLLKIEQVRPGCGRPFESGGVVKLGTEQGNVSIAVQPRDGLQQDRFHHRENGRGRANSGRQRRYGENRKPSGILPGSPPMENKREHARAIILSRRARSSLRGSKSALQSEGLGVYFAVVPATGVPNAGLFALAGSCEKLFRITSV